MTIGSTNAPPLGHDRCAGCGRLSRLYEQWPECTECSDHFCTDDIRITREPDEGDWGRGVCRRCDGEDFVHRDPA